MCFGFCVQNTQRARPRLAFITDSMTTIWALIQHPQSHLATLKPKYMYVSGQLSDSTTNGVIRLRHVRQRKPLNMNMKCLPSFDHSCKRIIDQTAYILTGHGPFWSHLAQMRLVLHEPSCPNCGSHEDTSMHFLLNCQKFHGVKNLHLTALCKLLNHRPPNTNLPNHGINICDLMDYRNSPIRSRAACV